MIALNPVEILPPATPHREGFAGIDELATSIARHGQLIPAIVEKCPDGAYRIIDGERRRLACLECHKPLSAEVCKDGNPALLRLAVNVGRDSYSDLEIARAIEDLQKQCLTQRQIASMLGKSESWVSDRLVLLRMNPSIERTVAAAKLSRSDRISIARKPMIQQGRHARRMIAMKIVRQPRGTRRSAPGPSREISDIDARMSFFLGAGDEFAEMIDYALRGETVRNLNAIASNARALAARLLLVMTR